MNDTAQDKWITRDLAQWETYVQSADLRDLLHRARAEINRYRGVDTERVPRCYEVSNPIVPASKTLCTMCGEHVNEHGAIPHEFVKPSTPARCLCGRSEYYHPWRFCDKFIPVK